MGASTMGLRYGRIAETYSAALTVLGFRRGVERFLDRLGLRFPAGARALAGGCGAGLVSVWLLLRFPDARVLAFDVDPGMLAIARRTAARFERDGRLELALGDLRRADRVTRIADGRPIGLAPGSFDGIFVGAALEHVPLQETVRRLAALLRPAGLPPRLPVRESGLGPPLAPLHRLRP